MWGWKGYVHDCPVMLASADDAWERTEPAAEVEGEIQRGRNFIDQEALTIGRYPGDYAAN